MAEGWPRVSVGMPVYNEEAHLEAALNALQAQTFEDFEVVICDNASTDRTEEICRDHAAEDRRIRYERSEENLGSIANLNRTLRGSRGELFCWASGHDTRTPDFIARCVDVMTRNPEAVLAYPRARWLDVDGTEGDVIEGGIDTCGLDPVSAGRVVLWRLGYAYPMYGMLRAEALRRTPGMRAFVGPDVLLLFELSLLGTFCEIPEPLLFMRRLPDFGSWQSYFAKSFGPGHRSGSSALSYGRWVLEHLSIAVRHAPGLIATASLSASVLRCAATRYRFVLGGLRAQERIERGAGTANG